MYILDFKNSFTVDRITSFCDLFLEWPSH